MERIACLYLAEFPAWVRRQLAPGEQFIAVHADGRIIASTEELRAAGLHYGESLGRAERLFPDASFYEHDPQLESAIWEDLLYLIADVGPQLAPVKPGWALLHPWDERGLEELSGSLRGRLGIAPRRFAAMLAALQSTSGSVRRVQPQEMRSFLEQTGVRYLAELGFEQEMLERLELFGLDTLGRVMPLTRRHLQAQFGADGVRLFEMLHPETEERPIPLFQPPPTIAVSYDFEQPSLEPAELFPVLDHLIHEAAGRLGPLRAQILTLRLQGRGGSGVRLVRRVLKEPTAQVRPLYTIAASAMHRLLAAQEPVDAMTFELGGLIQPEGVQGGLFNDRPAVFDAVRTIHRRFPGRLFRAVITDALAYIPEEGIRLEPYPEAPPHSSKKRRGTRR